MAASLARVAVSVWGWHRQGKPGQHRHSPAKGSSPCAAAAHGCPWPCTAPERCQDIQPSHTSFEEGGRTKLCHTMFVYTENCFPCPSKVAPGLGLVRKWSVQAVSCTTPLTQPWGPHCGTKRPLKGQRQRPVPAHMAGCSQDFPSRAHCINPNLKQLQQHQEP